MTRKKRSIHVLLVEDDPAQVMMYTVKFKQEGFQVSSAFTETEGIKKAKELKPDVVLLDIRLQDQNTGLNVLKAIRDDPACKNVRVIVFTAFSRSAFGFGEQANKLGADDFIVKTERLPGEIADDVKRVAGET